MVFDDAFHAAEFSLRLSEMVATTNWKDMGLVNDLSVRIGMHTGPVFCAKDPIIQDMNYFGTHVTRAARIEPVVAPGSVYVSEEMANIIALRPTEGFVCDYLGRVDLAKNYKTTNLFRLRSYGDVDF